MKPAKGIAIAVAAMWALASLGGFILIHSHHWFFLADETMPSALSLQVLCFYVALCGAKLPSAVIPGFIIAYTDVRRPYMTALVTVFTFQIVAFGITLLRWPWAALPALPSSVPIAGEMVNIILLTASAAFGVWWRNLWNRLLSRKKRANKACGYYVAIAPSIIADVRKEKNDWKTGPGTPG